MGEPVNMRNNEQIIDITSSNSSYHEEDIEENQASNRSLSRPNSSNSSSSSSTRRLEAQNTRQRSPINSGLWISIEFIFMMGQIIAAIVVLSLSSNEKPEAPLFTWIVGYASGCAGMLIILYWRYFQINQTTRQDSNSNSESTTQTISLENQHRASSSTSTINRTRMTGLIGCLKVLLDLFFAIWFVVGNVWIFGDHSSASEAPKLYKLCLVFLLISFIGYAMPFILCATICCCLPCIITALGNPEDVDQNRGATLESINALPTYKFKMKGKKDNNLQPNDDVEEGAACCVCLADYEEEDELKELPCVHYFHTECIDKWLQINATCPLCKKEVGTRIESSVSVSVSTTNTS